MTERDQSPADPGSEAERPRIASETQRARVLAAIEAIYEENGGTRKPTVLEVRKRSGVDMNATAEVVAEWKLRLSAGPKPVAVVVPESVMDAFKGVLGVAWAACEDVANNNLRSAQATWDREREEIVGMRRELASLYEEASDELDELRGKHAGAVRELESANARENELQNQIHSLREQLVSQTGLTEQATIRAEEILHRADDLKSELDKAHEENQQARIELRDVRLQHVEIIKQNEAVAAAEIQAVRQELAIYQGRSQEAIASRDERISDLQMKLNEHQGQFAELQTQYVTLKADVGATERINSARRKEMADAALAAAERFTQLQTERDNALRHASQLENHASKLEGKVESLEMNNKSLMAALPKPNSKN